MKEHPQADRSRAVRRHTQGVTGDEVVVYSLKLYSEMWRIRRPGQRFEVRRRELSEVEEDEIVIRSLNLGRRSDYSTI